MKSTNEEMVRQIFQIFDQDGNGLISQNEFIVSVQIEWPKNNSNDFSILPKKLVALTMSWQNMFSTNWTFRQTATWVKNNLEPLSTTTCYPTNHEFSSTTNKLWRLIFGSDRSFCGKIFFEQKTLTYPLLLLCIFFAENAKYNLLLTNPFWLYFLVFLYKLF